MKILLATGIYPPQIGGPAQYAANLGDEFLKQGHQVQILTYGVEKHLPSGVRHLYFFLKTLWVLPGTSFILALDTFSVAWPAVLAARLFNKKIIIRTGGDFLWETYVERTGDLILLRDFYQTSLNKLSKKEQMIYRLSRWTLQHASLVVFSTAWQRDIFRPAYSLDSARCRIIENYYG